MIYNRLFAARLTFLAMALLPACLFSMENQLALTEINRLALQGEVDELEAACAKNPRVINDVGSCETTFWNKTTQSNTQQTLIATPLWLAIFSDNQPEKKIECLSRFGANLDNPNNGHHIDPFCLAMARHEGEHSTKTRSIIITLLRMYPEAINRIDYSKNTPLMNAARMVDKELVAFIIHQENSSARSKNWKSDIQSALDSAQKAEYNYRHSSLIRPFENFFCKDLFESHKKACIALLEDALTPPVTQTTEAPNKKRD